MNASGTIIDVDPVESARDGAGAAAGGFKSPSYGRRGAAASSDDVAHATVIGGGKARRATGRMAGVAQAAAGGALVLVGIPMLILPGPCLLAIGGGAALAAGGIKKMRGR